MKRLYNKNSMNLILVAFSFGLVTAALTSLPTQSHAIMQVAGGNNVTVSPGGTQPFTWTLINDATNQTMSMQLSVSGNGSEFVSIPQNADLIPQEATDIAGTVTAPQNASSGTYTATLKAQEVDADNGTSAAGGAAAELKIVPVKTLTILVQ